MSSASSWRERTVKSTRSAKTTVTKRQCSARSAASSARRVTKRGRAVSATASPRRPRLPRARRSRGRRRRFRPRPGPRCRWFGRSTAGGPREPCERRAGTRWRDARPSHVDPPRVPTSGHARPRPLRPRAVVRSARCRRVPPPLGSGDWHQRIPGGSNNARRGNCHVDVLDPDRLPQGSTQDRYGSAPLALGLPATRSGQAS